MVNSKCFIHCLNDFHEPIQLEHFKAITLGRSPLTKIKEKRCSKKQVELTANCEQYFVTYKHVGSNGGGYNGCVTKAGEVYKLHHADIFEFLFGQFPHKVAFIPAPPKHSHLEDVENSSLPLSQKRSSASLLELSPKRKREDFEENGERSLILTSPSNNCNKWETFYNGDLIVYNQNAPPCTKVAAYDMDGTLISTVSGLVFPRDANDWKILYPQVPSKLKKLIEDGYKIVIFTNQAGIARGKTCSEEIKTKITNLIRKLGVSAQALISTGRGKYRKPITGMWDFFIDQCNSGMQVNKSDSFYIGDAAGRPAIPKQRKKDHAMSDRLFALNLNLPFYTPEEHFLGHKTGPFNMPVFIPSEVGSKPLYIPESTSVPLFPLEVILLVGYPGCGKSTFVDKHLRNHGYVSVNRDSVGSWQKCVSLMESSVKKGQHVVVDNTNPDKSSRARFVNAAKKLSVPIRCFVFDVSLEHAKHNNKFRELIGSDHEKINDMIYNMYKSKYEKPQPEEGFCDIITVNFVPFFKNKENEELYKSFLLEK